MKKNFKKYFIILLPIILAGASSLFFSSDLSGINMPPYSPSAFVFPIVWSTLYLLIGYSLYLVKNNKLCIQAFIIQLFLNLSWSIIFFNYNLYFIGLLIIFLLILAVMNMLFKFNNENKTSMILNIPYFIWLLIAYYLASGIYVLN